MSADSEKLRPQEILARFSRFHNFAAGEVIIQENEMDDRVYFILSGLVQVTNYSLNGKEIWHSELEAGTFFGELAALTGEPRSANITAVEESRVAILTKSELFDLIRHDPDIGLWLLEELAHRLKQRTVKVSALVAQSTSQRIRAELLRLAEADPGGGDALLIRPVPNFTEMARRLNTDRENVSREVSALKRQGALKRDKDHILILKPDFLERSSAL